MSSQKQSFIVLTSSTISFTVCFMVWMMFAVIGIPLKEQLQLSETEFGILTALPVLSGSLIRIPLGIWTDRYGGRLVFALLMFSCVIPIYLLQYATAYWHLLIIGLFIGLSGGSFSVGTPYVARWFSKNRQGLAMGIFGAGNAGAAVNKFIAPSIIANWGWHMVATVYAAVMLITAVLFSIFSFSKKEHIVSSSITLGQQLRMMKEPAVIRYCQYYAIVFGGYVALSLWMVHYYVDVYQVSLKEAALLAACFSLPGGVLRAWGGYLSDKYGAYRVTWYVMWVCLIVFFILSIPQTTLNIAGTPLMVGVNLIWFTIFLFFAGIAMAIGKASVFKFISDKYPGNIGTVSGVVGLAGGLGGFIFPILFGWFVDLTGFYASSFIILFASVLISIVWMALTKKDEMKTEEIIEDKEFKLETISAVS